MNKEFIPYEEAMALKELGFDEPCFGLYSDEELDYRVPNDVPLPKNSEYDDSRFVVAPLYQEAFKWFRELGFDSSIYRARTKAKIYCWTISNLSSGLEYPPSMIGEKSDTYEEAELACLKKLIEIVKKKTNE
jgi:hypothetical protein